MVEILGGKTDFEGIFGALNKKATAAPKPLSITDYVDVLRGQGDDTRVPATEKYSDFWNKYFAPGADPTTTTAEAEATAETAGIFEGITATIESFIGRAAIIILGFVFVAAGLAMFKIVPAPIINVAKTVKGAM